ncbi:MAG: acetolactate synthase [Alphaproteobacteria bacterium RIFCSPLOWO2_01_FULL_40_26]|nr:MAG: acetolactate synthase [Alphaproteobacteria bacterium RIFCSPHIGHO2_02_FULL_40_34]OFW95391.1 MAG: acetolactate synthase [Alphaproteobacteria bacterium RIFCSPLOWO2_01_FULL_40_26]OFX10031.1 MAG: acetolactate synthase [Alphaproteobacteria bacterium RIFCSPLOWO2_02_FULL_40_19]OFX11665.1 MAG: acetolactate synthase [Alphaproteobacteria bacterium RIFCSPLOWO2_12_FULL_40_11]
MIGAEYIAEFFRQRGSNKFFLVTGGACTFIVDAIGRNPKTDYVCFQHEQAAAMAADSLWRIDRTVGVTVATSGPGATNLITGIACSYFDSIPTIHLTGQVNQSESANFIGTQVRQAGFQETNIVDMVKPIIKYAVQVKNGEELKIELEKAYNLAISDRKGPVLIDIPMNIQKEEVGDVIIYNAPKEEKLSVQESQKISQEITKFFKDAKRPVVLFGAGVGLSGADKDVVEWLSKNSSVPFVASWNGMTYFNHNMKNYHGQIGVYGNRGANFLLQNCDALLVLGSRLDNRQRSGNPKSFAPVAKVCVIDVDAEELKKYKNEGYKTIHLNLTHSKEVLTITLVSSQEWIDYAASLKKKFFGKDASEFSKKNNSLSPYVVVQKINKMISDDAVVVADDGANLCWVFQIFHRTNQVLYTAGGNSPMAYSLPAAIGAALHQPKREVIAFTGDGSFQMNIQELQTAFFHKLNLKLFILNNDGYGIIKQFQDIYFGGRHEATGHGYSAPDFKKVVEAYGVKYFRVESLADITKEIFDYQGPAVIDVILHQNTLIEPKLEMERPIHDQYPYLPEAEVHSLNKFNNYCRTKK